MKKLFTRIIFSLLFLNAFMSHGQITVKIYETYVNNVLIGSNSPIEFSGNQSINIKMVIDVESAQGENPMYPGTLYIYRSNTSNLTNAVTATTPQPMQINGNYGTHTFNFTLSPSNFNATGGVVFAEYKTYGGALKKSANKNVIKTVTPAITNNTISGNQSVNYGQVASALTGSQPGGGNGTYTYSWSTRIGSSQWSTISSATSSNYSPGVMTTSAEFKRTVNSGGAQPIDSNIINITVLPTPAISNNVITGDQTINEGTPGSTLIGNVPSGGLGTFQYQWQKKTSSSAWTSISETSATSKNYNPGSPFENTMYRRIARSGNASQVISNEVMITVIPAPPIFNNTITISGSIVTGSLPTGGTGSYTYTWTVYFQNSDIEMFVLPYTTQSIEIPNSVYNLVDGGIGDVYIFRSIKSGSQTSGSNSEQIIPSVEIDNNIISISGNQLIGSLPTGGNSLFTYEWYGYNHFEGEVIGEVFPLVGTSQNNTIQITPGLPTNYYRIVKSANKISYSNQVTYGASRMASQSLNIEKDTKDVKVYPNPTTKLVNFETNLLIDSNVEVLVFSEIEGKSISIFKGNINSGQIIEWNIPSNYKKGIYFYKIISEGKEVKTGKILYQ